MSDTDNQRPRKPLTLRSSQPGEVKQTFSHGRTNRVVVEVKRRKILKPGGEGAEIAPASVVEEVALAPAPAPLP